MEISFQLILPELADCRVKTIMNYKHKIKGFFSIMDEESTCVVQSGIKVNIAPISFDIKMFFTVRFLVKQNKV